MLQAFYLHAPQHLGFIGGLSASSSILLIMALAFGFYMAWNIGANDVANAMGTSVGSGALTLKRAIIVAAVFEFAGAFLVGSNVSGTIRKGIFDPTLIEDPLVLAKGMIGCLLAAGIWLQVASYFGWPVSTTHSIVGAVVGFGCVSVGPSNINWLTDGDGQFGGVIKIAASWLVSPLIAGSIAYLIFRFIQKSVLQQPNPILAAKKVTPPLVFFVLVVLTGVASFKGLKHLWKKIEIDGQTMNASDPTAMAITAGVAVMLGLIGAVISWYWVRTVKAGAGADRSGAHFDDVYTKRSIDKARKHLRRIRDHGEGDMRKQAADIIEKVDAMSREAREKTLANPLSTEDKKSTYVQVERIFVALQILSACFVAFAHGANDVANAIGPLAAAVQGIMADGGELASKIAVPTWALLLGGTGIVIGLATWGWRVMETIGRRITELTPTRGFAAELAAAITILVASLPWFAVPISTTHTLVGAVLGVGLARGIGALNLKTLRDIAASWVVTIPAGALLSITFFYTLNSVF